MRAAQLRAEWIAEAYNLGREHALAGGPTSDDGPLDVINLQQLSDAMDGAGISYGELADLQDALEAAYVDGRRG